MYELYEKNDFAEESLLDTDLKILLVS